MDGNGRWATQKTWNRIRGHHEGAKRVDEIVTEATELGIRYLTLYTFSTENWNRPKTEVLLLMQLLCDQLKTMDKKLYENRVSLKTQGQIHRLPNKVQKELARVTALTHFENPNLTLSLALSYGGRQEIVEAAQKLALEAAAGKISPNEIDEKLFQKYLYQPEIPDPDLLIRTGGDHRVSNFLLWEIAYTELYITPTLWPDFRKEDFHDALFGFSKRERRYGKTSQQILEELR